MTAGPARSPAAPLAAPLDLLERAVAYTRGVLVGVRPDALWCPTPCEGWDLAALLHHMEDSLVALTQAADLGRVPLRSQPPDPPEPRPTRTTVPVVRRLQTRACALLGAWSAAPTAGEPTVGGAGIPVSVLGRAGALDVAVHGWDVSASLGPARDLPAALADDLLPVARALVTDADRPRRFAAPVPVATTASPSERLLAFLGRPS
jgi:uncharacterized protein (TIGR03086 family)